MKNFLKFTMASLVLVFAISCSKDDSGDEMNGEAYNTIFKITDAPIDNANVEAVFVTVAAVKADGKALEGFSKSTINLASLVNGHTETLGNLDLQAGTYSNLELILDYETDAAGNAPGCYVEMADGTKDELTASAENIHVNDSFEVLASATNEIIIDFDLRKTIKEEQGTLSSNFEFVSMSELSAGVRTVNENLTGSIKGTVNDSQNTSDKILVYAYKKGTFDAEAETKGSGESGVTFSNAVCSAAVTGIQKGFSLHFLEAGEYELVFVSYKEDEQGSGFKFNALLQAESNTGINLGSISVTGALQLNTSVTITGTR